MSLDRAAAISYIHLVGRASMAERKAQFCINCDNRHGCKSGTPPCIAEMDRDGVTGRSGKGYLLELGRIGRCEACAFVRSCWNPEEYLRAKAVVEKPVGPGDAS